MLKSPQAKLQQYVNWEFPDVRTGFRKDRETIVQIASICWIIEKAREFKKNIYFCFIDYAKVFDCVDHNKLENSSREAHTRPPYLSPEKLVWGQEATVRTGQGRSDWFKIEKGVQQGCILSLCLFNFCAEYIMWNVGLDESQSGIKTARRSVNNLWYADNTTLMAESKEELKSLLMRVWKEYEKLAWNSTR